MLRHQCPAWCHRQSRALQPRVYTVIKLTLHTATWLPGGKQLLVHTPDLESSQPFQLCQQLSCSGRSWLLWELLWIHSCTWSLRCLRVQAWPAACSLWLTVRKENAWRALQAADLTHLCQQQFWGNTSWLLLLHFAFVESQHSLGWKWPFKMKPNC